MSAAAQRATGAAAAWHLATAGSSANLTLTNALHSRSSPLLPVDRGVTAAGEGSSHCLPSSGRVTATAVAPTHKVVATALRCEDAPLTQEFAGSSSLQIVSVLVTHAAGGSTQQVTVPASPGLASAASLLAFSSDGVHLAAYIPALSTGARAIDRFEQVRGAAASGERDDGTDDSTVGGRSRSQPASISKRSSGESVRGGEVSSSQRSGRLLPGGRIVVWRWAHNTLVCSAMLPSHITRLHFRPLPRIPGTDSSSGLAGGLLHSARIVLSASGPEYLRLWCAASDGRMTESALLNPKQREQELFVDHCWLAPPPSAAAHGTPLPPHSFLPGGRLAVVLERGAIYVLTVSTSRHARIAGSDGTAAFGSSMGAGGDGIAAAAGMPGGGMGRGGIAGMLGGARVIDGVDTTSIGTHGLPLEYDLWQEVLLPVPRGMRGLPGYTWTHVSPELQGIAAGSMSQRLISADDHLRAIQKASDKAVPAAASASSSVLVDLSSSNATFAQGSRREHPEAFDTPEAALAAAAVSTARDVMPALYCVQATEHGFVVGGENGYLALCVMPHLVNSTTARQLVMDIPLQAAVECAAAKRRAADKAKAVELGVSAGAGGPSRPRVLYTLATAVRAGLGSGYGDGSFLVGDLEGQASGGGGLEDAAAAAVDAAQHAATSSAGGVASVSGLLDEEASPDLMGRLLQADALLGTSRSLLSRQGGEATGSTRGVPPHEALLLGGGGSIHRVWSALHGKANKRHLHRLRVGQWCPPDGTVASGVQADAVCSLAVAPAAFEAAVRDMWKAHMGCVPAGDTGVDGFTGPGSALGELEYVPVDKHARSEQVGEDADTLLIGGGGRGMSPVAAMRDSSWVGALARAVWVGGKPQPGDAVVVSQSPGGGVRVTPLLVNRVLSSRLEHQQSRDASVPLSLRGGHRDAVSSIGLATWKPTAVTLAPVERCIRVWNLRSWACDVVHYTVDEPTSVDVHPAGQLLAVAFADRLCTMHILTHSLRQWKTVPAVQKTRSVKFSHSGSYLAVSAAGGIAVFDVLTMTPLWRLLGQPAQSLDVAWSRSDSVVASGGADGSVMTWHLPPWAAVAYDSTPTSLDAGAPLPSLAQLGKSASATGTELLQGRGRSSTTSMRAPMRPAPSSRPAGGNRRGSLDAGIGSVQVGPGGSLRPRAQSPLGTAALTSPDSALGFPRAMLAAPGSSGIDPGAVSNVWGYAMLATLAGTAGVPLRPMGVKRDEHTSCRLKTGRACAVALNYDGTVVVAAAHSRRIVLAAVMGGPQNHAEQNMSAAHSQSAASTVAQRSKVTGTRRVVNYSSVLALAGYGMQARLRTQVGDGSVPTSSVNTTVHRAISHGSVHSVAGSTDDGTSVRSSAHGSVAGGGGADWADGDDGHAIVCGDVITCLQLNSINTVMYAGMSSGHVRTYAWPLQGTVSDVWREKRVDTTSSAASSSSFPNTGPAPVQVTCIAGTVVPTQALRALVDAELMKGSFGAAPFERLRLGSSPVTSMRLDSNDSTLMVGTACGALHVLGVPQPAPQAVRRAAEIAGLVREDSSVTAETAVVKRGASAESAHMLAAVRRLAHTSRLGGDASTATPSYLLTLMRAAALDGPCTWPSPAWDTLLDTSAYTLVHRTAVSSAYRRLASAEVEHDELRARLETTMRMRERELQDRVKSLQESGDTRAARERKRHDDLLVQHEEYVRAQVKQHEQVHASAAAMVQSSENAYEEKLALERERFDRLSSAAMSAAQRHEEEMAALAAAAAAEQQELRSQLQEARREMEADRSTWRVERKELVSRFEALLSSTAEDQDTLLGEMDAKHTAQSAGTEDELQQRTQEVIALKRYVRDFRKAAQAAQEMLSNKEEALGTVEARVEQLRRQLGVKEAKIESLRAELGSKEGAVTTLKGDVRILTGWKYVLEQQNQGLAEAEAPLRQTVDALRGTLGEVQVELREHHATQVAVGRARLDEKAKLGAYEGELGRLRGSVGQLQVQLNSVVRDIQLATEGATSMGSKSDFKGGLPEALSTALMVLHSKYVTGGSREDDVLKSLRKAQRSKLSVTEQLSDWSAQPKAAAKSESKSSRQVGGPSAVLLSPVKGLSAASAVRDTGKLRQSLTHADSKEVPPTSAQPANVRTASSPVPSGPGGADSLLASGDDLKTVEEVVRQRNHLQSGIQAHEKIVNANLTSVRQARHRTMQENTVLIAEMNELRRSLQAHKAESMRLTAALQRHGIRLPSSKATRLASLSDGDTAALRGSSSVAELTPSASKPRAVLGQSVSTPHFQSQRFTLHTTSGADQIVSSSVRDFSRPTSAGQRTGAPNVAINPGFKLRGSGQATMDLHKPGKARDAALKVRPGAAFDDSAAAGSGSLSPVGRKPSPEASSPEAVGISSSNQGRSRSPTSGATCSPRSSKSRSPRPLALRRRPDLLTAHHAPATVVDGSHANTEVQRVAGTAPSSPSSKYDTEPKRIVSSSSPRAGSSVTFQRPGSSRDATASSIASGARARTNSLVRIDTLGSHHPLGQATDAAYAALVAEGAIESLPLSPSRRAEGRHSEQVHRK